MCGIAGQVSLRGDRPVDREAVRRMTDAVAHRGPDGVGEYVSPRALAALGHRRLSIIDLVTGGQPIYNEDRTVAVVLNGEIYNFQALRAELEARGHRFGTRSDTEVIAHLYEDRGVDCVRALRGMFTILLWDERRGRLLAARDHLGKKPLYWTEHGGRLSLASEITALYGLEDLAWTLDPDAIDLYLTHSYIPSPASVLAAVRKLPAAHRMVVEDGTVTIDRFWSPPAVLATMSSEEAAAELERTLEDAVRLRMISDVPLGCFLSGGVDSSVVAALMSRLSPTPIRTFSIGFDRREYTELDHARTVARRFKTEHEEFTVTPDAAAVLPDLVRHFGEPFGDSSAVAVWYLAELARKRVTVALNGDGGDELFGGYLWYGTGLRLAAAARWLRPWARALSGGLGRGRLLAMLPRRAAKALALIGSTDEARFAALRRSLDAGRRDGLYSREFALRANGAALAYLEDAYERGSADPLHAMSVTDLVTYLPEDLLVKVDRMTMAWALEGRSPFLDTRVVELALSMPARLKLGAGGGKRVVKRAFGGLFAPGFLDRPKMGFSLPVDEWLRGELAPLVEARVLGPSLADAGIVDGGALRALVREHAAGRSHGAVLWNLLMLGEWFERYGGRARWAEGAPRRLDRVA
jgi:asparagine synthase (glutamine-hydrolysing)